AEVESRHGRVQESRMTTPTAGRAHALARTVIRRRWYVLAAWLVSLAALAPFAGRAERELEVAARVPGSVSGQVDAALRDRFHSPFATNATLVVTGLPSPSDSAGRETLRLIVATVERIPGVSG